MQSWQSLMGPLHQTEASTKIVTARYRRGAELVVRFNFILSAAIGFVTALMLTTCASPPRVVWEYYDQCARQNPSFLAMAECGRQKRLAECVPNNACSPEGNMFMEYIDTLVLSVKNKELTEAEAMRRYTEYKNEHRRTREARRGSMRSRLINRTSVRRYVVF